MVCQDRQRNSPQADRDHRLSRTSALKMEDTRMGSRSKRAKRRKTNSALTLRLHSMRVLTLGHSLEVFTAPEDRDIANHSIRPTQHDFPE